MSQNITKLTLGEAFLLELNKSESKGLMFLALENFVAAHYPRNNLTKQINRVSDFYSVAAYQSKLARIRIEYNARAVREIEARLVGLNNFGNDNYKYKEKIVRKLNLLINNLPTLDDIIYIAMATYVDRNYGSVYDFKEELIAHISENRADLGTEKLSVRCDDNVCHAESTAN